VVRCIFRCTNIKKEPKMHDNESVGYVVAPPNTPYSRAEDCPMMFVNGDISLDDAVAAIIASGKPFTVPNADMLAEAIMDTDWD